MFGRFKHFIITFIPASIFIFSFYYISTHIILDSIILAVVGATVIGGMVSLLMPFVRKGK